MRRWTWKTWVILTGSILLVIAGLSYWVMSLAVNKVLDSLTVGSIVAEKNIPSAEPIPTPTPTPAPTIAPIVPTAEAGGPVPEGSVVPGSSHSAAIDPVSQSQSKDKTVADNQPPVGSVAAKEPASSSLPYSAAIDTDKAQSAEDAISVQDKMLITSIFLKRFSSKELDAFMKLAKGGLTVEEKREAKKIVMEKLSEDEYNQLIAIAAKLGLSQGKSYQDSKNEFGH